MNKNKICGIYKITNKINNKCYIGKSIDIYNRWYDHKRAADTSSNDTYNRPLYQAFRKYGIEAFSFEILEECSEQMLSTQELFWISTFNCTWPNGYNIADTDWYNSFNKLTDDLVRLILNDLLNSELSIKAIASKYKVAYNLISDLNRGRILKYKFSEFKFPIISNDEIVKRNILENHSDSLNKYTFLKYWPEIKNSLESTNLTTTCEKFKVAATSLRRWLKYYNLPPVSTFLQANSYSYIVYQLTLDGNIINKFNSITEAALSVFKSKNYAGAISNVCNKKKRTAGGYQWCFEPDLSKIKPIINIGQSRKVLCVELNKTFNSLAEAARFIGCWEDAISNCCYNRTKCGMAFGYHWRFVEEKHD